MTDVVISFAARYGYTNAGVMELVDIPDLKSVGPCARAGSSPAARTNFLAYIDLGRCFAQFRETRL